MGWRAVAAAGTLLCALAASPEARAGAWTEKPGHGQLIASVSWFAATGQYGPTGAISPFGNAGQFRQIEVENYLELGLTKRLTLVVDVPVGNLEYRDRNSTVSDGVFGDVALAVRGRMNHMDSPWALSGQFTATAPAYKANANPAPGNHQEDVEARVLLGRSLAVRERRVFFDAEVAYRCRTGAPADQVRGDATAGVDVTRGVMVMGQLFTIKGLRNGSPVTANSNPNAQSDFDLYKAQGSVVVTIRGGTRLQLGAGQTFAGRNTGRGPTFVIGLWQRF